MIKFMTFSDEEVGTWEVYMACIVIDRKCQSQDKKPGPDHILAHTSGRSLLFYQNPGLHPEPQVRLPPTPPVLTQHNYNCSSFPHHHVTAYTSGVSLPPHQRPGQHPDPQRPLYNIQLPEN